jgi:hypothetical protein
MYKAHDCGSLPDAYQEMQSDFSGRRTSLKQTSVRPDVRTKKVRQRSGVAMWVTAGCRTTRGRFFVLGSTFS